VQQVVCLVPRQWELLAIAMAAAAMMVDVSTQALVQLSVSRPVREQGLATVRQPMPPVQTQGLDSASASNLVINNNKNAACGNMGGVFFANFRVGQQDYAAMS
jgi:hypothetical protein